MYHLMKVFFIFISICRLNALTLEILRVKKQSSMKVFDLWNLTNLHCGANTGGDLYRHDYIDRIDISCIDYWYNFFFEAGQFKYEIKYTKSNRHKMSGNLEQVLQEIPDYTTESDFYTNGQFDQYLTNQGNYEYLYKRPSSSTIFAGIYFDPANPGSSPQFVYSTQGSPYTANVDPSTFSSIETADYFRVYLLLNDSCDSASKVQNSGPCPVPTVPTVNTSMTYVTPQPGATLNLDCWYDSPVVVSGVKWAFTDKNNINREINETTKPSKYSGSTYSTPTLTVNSFSQSDEGLYICIVENFMGPGMSNVINASLAPYVEPMCPCNCEYKDKLNFWAAQNQTNHTMEELREILAPVLQKLEKELKVDTSNLSSTVNKRISAKDSRPSSQKLGMLGIVFLSLIVGGIILVDITSLQRHRDTVKKIGTRGSQDLTLTE
ncbi:uncharacterized protein LOC127728247 isoform X2 [Mytilus californianus]|uniref:uncharacterized protein LOC127728247 isoform X2 n=1 Tax=Mytilus californianus TaxID=6549 RepID=UPI0022474A85|nr:uncharacterized protein LOC127728247 isoform X2 [Mytilus californianus]